MTSPTLPHYDNNRRSGFALIGTLTLMILLALIMVGYLTTTAIHTRTTNIDLAQAEARANARLALMIALGEIQREMGPDQRISAQAAVLDENPDTEQIEGITHPRWTITWNTDWDRDDNEHWDGRSKSPWSRDDSQGGLEDARLEGSWDREDEVSATLVSGNEGGQARASEYLRASEDLPGDEEDQVTVVGEGSVGTKADDTDYVRVKKVRKADLTGAYGYWVGDLGVKANVGLVDRHSDQRVSQGRADGMERLYNAQKVEAEVMEGMNKINEEDAAKIVSQSSLVLAAGAAKEDVQKLFHETTADSLGIMVNVRDGGLKRDLTHYLEEGAVADLNVGGEIVSRGIRDDDRLAGAANTTVAGELYKGGGRITSSDTKRYMSYDETAPRYSLLRDWAEMAEDARFTTTALEQVPPQPCLDAGLIRQIESGTDIFDKANKKPAAFYPYRRRGAMPTMKPVMVEGSIYYHLATYPDTTGSNSSSRRWFLRICLYPRVALWNPYSVDISVPRTNAHFFVNGNKDINVLNTQRQKVQLAFGRGAPNRRPGGGEDRDGYPRHYQGTVVWTIPPVTIPAGQTLVFCPDQDGARYNNRDYSQNTLSADVTPDVSKYYYYNLRDELTRPPSNFFESPQGGNQSGADNYQMGLKLAPGTSSIPPGNQTRNGFDHNQMLSFINPSLQAGGGDELPVRWNSSSPVQVYRLSSPADKIPSTAAHPDVRTRDGFRLRWWQEHESNKQGSGRLSGFPEHLQTSVIGTWNPRAAYYCRTPFDNVTDQPPYFYGAYTRDMFDEEVSWQASMPRNSGGKKFGLSLRSSCGRP